MNEGDMIDAIMTGFSKIFEFSSVWSAAYENCCIGSGFDCNRVGQGTSDLVVRRRQRRTIMWGSRSNVRVPQRIILGPLVLLAYVKIFGGIWSRRLEYFAEDIMIYTYI